MKFKIHPLFIVLVFALLFFGQLGVVIGYLFAILTHEFAHSKAAELRGYNMESVTLMPYGGVLKGGDNFNKIDNIIIAIAGPIFNFCVAVVCVAVWWLFPQLYNFTLDLCLANLALGVLNLLPLYPLDGSRLVYSVCRNKLRCIQWLKLASIAVGIAMFGLGIAMLIIADFNPTLAIFGIFLAYSGFLKSDEDSYKHVTNNYAFNKNYLHGVKKTTYYIDLEMPLFRLLKMVNNNELCEFVALDKFNQSIIITEKQLEILCQQNQLTDSLRMALSNSKKYLESN